MQTTKQIRKLVRILRKHRPTSAEGLSCLGLKWKESNNGVFRSVYTFPDFPGAVLKLPLREGESAFSGGVVHARREIRSMRRARRRKALRHFRRYIPDVFWCDYKTGAILMRHYDARECSLDGTAGDLWRAEDKILENMFQDTARSRFNDTGRWNFGYDARGQLKLLDWGLV